ncbi:C-type lectin domain family 4 member M-like [Ruditapes philippinarum]|uniref:C-type lectin domain family 4 member M-like n=1 Tax=Ruditapes philippinarum TaxID=129788 RepID=UPI00295BF39D|nr:C-type lectin domain family 4 member M-like [Ruditapes philippinarum]
MLKLTGYIMHNLCFLFLCVLMVDSIPLRGRVDIIEKRIGVVESRMNSDNELAREMFLSLQQNFEDLNSSMINLKNQMCPIMDQCGVKEDQSDSEKNVEILQSSRVMMTLGLKREKQWVRDQVKKLFTQMGEHSDRLDQVTKMESDAYIEINKACMVMSSQQKEIEALKETRTNLLNALISKNEEKYDYTCPPDWKKYSSFCYLFSEDIMKFDEARAYCKLLGATVADFKNQAENDVIADLPKVLRFAWIGYSDEEKEGTWISERTGQPASFTNFADGQPSGGIHQNCAVLHFYNGKWHDWTCHSGGKWHVVCKKDATIEFKL